MGKELRGDPERGLRELRARAAASSAMARSNGAGLMALEATLKGQEQSGSTIVAELWSELGWDRDDMMLERKTYSTRQEAMLSTAMMKAHGFTRVAVFTSSYHQKRTWELFSDHLPTNRFEVLPLEGMLEEATDLERRWIQDGVPSETTLRTEARKERVWTVLSRLGGPLPNSMRWSLECFAGRCLRKASSF